MSPFLEAWSHTGREEGGFADNPQDSGGPTNFGITERVARAHGFMGDMRDLPLDRAREIAKAAYWDIMRLDDVAALSSAIANELFDSGFLCGIGTSGRWLQRALNAANRQGKDYPDLLVDNIVGAGTVSALRQFLALRGKPGEKVMLAALNAFQGVYLTELAERREKDETFWFGWLLNRVA